MTMLQMIFTGALLGWLVGASIHENHQLDEILAACQAGDATEETP